MKMISILSMVLVGAIAITAGADTITVEGETYEDVYVREASAMVFIQVPNDGSIIPVSKSNVDELVIHSDEDHRKALLAKWEENRALSNAMRSNEQGNVANPAEQEVPALSRPVEHEPPESGSRAEPTAPPAWVELRVNGNSHRVDARRVNLAGVIEQLAHPMEPDAAVRQGRIRLTNTAPSGTRNRTINEVASRATHAAVSRNTVPRIVVNNPSGSGVGSTGNPRLAGAGAAGFSGGMGTTGIGNTAGGIGTTGFGGQQGGFGGQMGGFGGQMGGVGGQMGGGGFGAGAGAGAAHFTNISQLFTNINDMMVGEAPAQIGLQSSFWQSTPPIPAPGGWANPERLGIGGGMAGQMGRAGVGMGGQMGQPGAGMAGQMGRRF